MCASSGSLLCLTEGARALLTAAKRSHHVVAHREGSGGEKSGEDGRGEEGSGGEGRIMVAHRKGCPREQVKPSSPRPPPRHGRLERPCLLKALLSVGCSTALSGRGGTRPDAASPSHSAAPGSAKDAQRREDDLRPRYRYAAPSPDADRAPRGLVPPTGAEGPSLRHPAGFCSLGRTCEPPSGQGGSQACKIDSIRPRSAA